MKQRSFRDSEDVATDQKIEKEDKDCCSECDSGCPYMTIIYVAIGLIIFYFFFMTYLLPVFTELLENIKAHRQGKFAKTGF